jgi:hypothetical protein
MDEWMSSDSASDADREFNNRDASLSQRSSRTCAGMSTAEGDVE